MIGRVAIIVWAVGALAAGAAGQVRATGNDSTLTANWPDGKLESHRVLDLTDAEIEWIARDHDVAVAVGPYPPYVFISPEGVVSGISIDYLGEISARTGIEFVLERRLVSYPEALDSMLASQGPDLMPCTLRNAIRPLEFSIPYISTEMVIFTQTNAPFVGGVEDLHGRTVAAQKGVAAHLGEAASSHNFELLPVEQDGDGLRALATGQVDAYIGDLLIGSVEIQRLGLANVKVAAPSPFAGRAFSFGMRPDWPQLRGIIDKALASMSAAEHAAIRTKNLGVRYEHGIKSSDVLRWIGLVAGAALFLVCLAIVWNRQLARRVRIRTAELTVASDRLRSLASELTVAEERERRRLAADLHDQVGQPLALARVQLAAKIGDEIKSSTVMKDVSETLLIASQETRRLIADLSTPSMGPLGLAAAISDWMDDRLARSTNLSMEVIDECVPGSIETLDESTRAILFRNARELLTNVIKHAHASRVVVRLSTDADAISVRIEDDGVGFDPAVSNKGANDNGGFGLFSVAERMEDLGGSATIRSRDGEGCVVELQLPFRMSVEHAELSKANSMPGAERATHPAQ